MIFGILALAHIAGRQDLMRMKRFAYFNSDRKEKEKEGVERLPLFCLTIHCLTLSYNTFVLHCKTITIYSFSCKTQHCLTLQQGVALQRVFTHGRICVYSNVRQTKGLQFIWIGLI
jgi:hypothetical protein